MNPTWRIAVGDCRRLLAELDEESVQTVVTSPPYFGLRDYGTGIWEGGDPECDHVKGEMRRGIGLAGSAVSVRGGGKKVAEIEDITYGSVCGKCGALRVDDQIGLEGSPEEYVDAMVDVFREVRRVLRWDGTVWLNIGDSYNAADTSRRWPSAEESYGKHTYVEDGEGVAVRANAPGLKPKDLIGIPWRIAFALQQDGWYLRSEVVWAKPNPMPESVTDRPTKAHEQLFLLTKSQRYFYDRDAIREPHADSSVMRVQRKWHNPGHKWEDGPGNHDLAHSAEKALPPGGRNKRSVWEIPEEAWSQFLAWLDTQPQEKLDVWGIATVPFKAAHFATFPPKLVEPCLLAGTPEEGSCSECGAPWTRIARQDRVVDGEEVVEGGWNQDEAGRIGAAGVGHWRFSSTSITLGWRPTCTCGAPEGIEPDDLDLIESPTGEGGTEDPSLSVGRAGYARPRGKGSGRETITRYQQRCYAEQLKTLPATKRRVLKRLLGITDDAWAHYVRTDKSGARPLPPKLLAHVVDAGLVIPVEPPEWEPPPPRPALVLDPFAGAGTTGLVAMRLGRSFIGLELNPDYAEGARQRIRDDAPLMNYGAEAPETPGEPA